MQNFNIPIPLSLYVHLPWCVRKCPYCDFNSHEARDTLPEELYINALIRDLEQQLPRIWGRRIHSIFFGGGTPSLFSPANIRRILTEIHTRLPYGPETEITLEANPGTLDESRFIGFREAGINRLSIGLQSLQEEKLKALGRIHDRNKALDAIRMAQQAGFTNFNLDLMHGLPGQTLEEALADLRDALAFQPTHLSWYQLTIEPNTLFHHQPPVLPPDDLLWEIQEAGVAVLANAGMQQYEVSAYCQPNYSCAHNVNYWEFGDYLGIGAGAHSKLTDIEQQCITRHWQVKHPKEYMDPTKNLTAEKKILAENDVIFEFMLNALRLTEGVSVELFSARTGLPVERLTPTLSIAQAKGLMAQDPERLCATPLGQRYLNDVMQLFLP